MCQPFSCIAHRTLGILVNTNVTDHSHQSIINANKLKDTKLENRNWVKLELTPDYGTLLDPCNGADWTLRVDEMGTLPAWWETSVGGKLQTAAFKAVTAWQKRLKAAKAAAKAQSVESPAMKQAKKALEKKEKALIKIHNKMADLEDEVSRLQNEEYELQNEIDDLNYEIDNLDEEYTEVEMFYADHGLNV